MQGPQTAEKTLVKRISSLTTGTKLAIAGTAGVALGAFTLVSPVISISGVIIGALIVAASQLRPQR